MYFAALKKGEGVKEGGREERRERTGKRKIYRVREERTKNRGN